MEKILLLFLLFFSIEVIAQPNIVYNQPITITKGGTYTGNYKSLDSDKPCIIIATSEPVILSKCTLVGAGDLIKVYGYSTLDVINCSGYGITQSKDNVPRGRFINMYMGRHLTLEHNYMEHTSGMLIDRWDGNGSTAQTITVRYNKALNCDKRYKNGSWGDHRAALQLNTVRSVPFIDISYNQFINKPNESLVEDNINIYNSSGTSSSYIKIHDNLIYGAYPIPATSSSFTGSGITVDGDGYTGGTYASTSSYVQVEYNQIVATCNAAMNIAIGHHIIYRYNRMVTSASLEDGTPLPAVWAACCIFNGSNLSSEIFRDNLIADNIIGFTRVGNNFPYVNRHDQDVASSSNLMPLTGNIHLPNPITIADEKNELIIWNKKLADKKIIVGIQQ